MNRLKSISRLLNVFKWLLIAGIFFAVVFITFINGELILLGSPSLTFDQEVLQQSINEVLRPENGMKYHISKIDVEVPPTPQLRLVIIAAAILYGGFVFWILQIIIKIVEDIRQSRAFRSINITRLKRIALLFVVAPLLGSLVDMVFTLIVGSIYELPGGQTFTAGFDFDFTLFVVGMLLYAIAYAFGEGLKMKEEQELTI